jgi:hypothetical protein
VFSTQQDLNPTYKKIIVMDKLSEEEDDDEEDDDDEEEEEEEEEEEKEIIYNDLEVIEMNDLLEEEEKIVLEEKEPENTINVLKLEQEQEQEQKVETPVLPIVSNPVSISYDKLNLNELKMLVITKGLSTNPNKLKKMELLKLLEEETI